jgi:DHA1 family tetracycline resistance protein-like MFS transporter
LAKHAGLQQSFLLTVVGMGMSLFCVGVLFSETLVPGKRKPFRWTAANPVGSASMLLRHPILVRFLLLLVFVDLAANQSTTPYFILLSGYGPEENGVISSLQAAVTAAGLLVLLPLMQRYLSLRMVIILSVLGSTIALFMNAMLAWHIIAVWPGVQAWPFVCSVAGISQAIWYPPMRALCAGIFGPERFGVALGAIATVQAVNSAVGPTLWPIIYSLSLRTNGGGADSVGSASSGSSSGGGGVLGGGGMPELVFYISSAWCSLGCIAAFSLPRLAEADLDRAAAMLSPASVASDELHLSGVEGAVQ